MVPETGSLPTFMSNPYRYLRGWCHAAMMAALLTLPPALLRADGDAEAQTTVFTGARLIDGSGQPALEDAVLMIRNGRVVAVGAGNNAPKAPAGARIIDTKGQTIIPGLISAHSHLGLVKGASAAAPENYTRDNVARQLAQYEAYGVTAVMSLGVNRDVLYDWREEQRQGKLAGADIFTADRGLGVPAGVPPFSVPGNQVYRPNTPDEARADVRQMAARHPDLVKLWLDDNFGTMPKMSPDVYAAAVSEAHAAVDEAHQHGLRVAAHLFYLADAKALLQAGVDVLAHSVRDQQVDDELVAQMLARKAMYIPTLALDESQYVYAEHPEWMDSPFFTRAVDPGLLATWLSPEYAAKMRTSPSTPRNRAAHAWAMKNVKILHDAGVPIALGTDSGAMPTRLAGFDEHRELQLLVEAGLTPMQAIVCGTMRSAEAIGQGQNRGTLVPGKKADFVVLSANPLEDIRNSTRITAVWHGGTKVRTINDGPVILSSLRQPEVEGDGRN